jgi:hypothetical protein
MFIHVHILMLFFNLGLEFGNSTARLHEKVSEEAIVQVDIGFSGLVKKFPQNMTHLFIKFEGNVWPDWICMSVVPLDRP